MGRAISKRAHRHNGKIKLSLEAGGTDDVVSALEDRADEVNSVTAGQLEPDAACDGPGAGHLFRPLELPKKFVGLGGKVLLRRDVADT